MAMMTVNGRRLQAHLEALADIARTPDGICRLSYSDSFWKSNAYVAQLMREAGSPWKVSVAVDPKLIGATNVRLIANKIAGEPTPATYDFKAAAIPQALLAAQPGAVNVASLGKIIPGWGQTEDFIAPWFATLEAKNK